MMMFYFVGLCNKIQVSKSIGGKVAVEKVLDQKLIYNLEFSILFLYFCFVYVITTVSHAD